MPAALHHRRYILPVLIILAGAGLCRSADDPSIGRLRQDLTFLTSDECEGRGAQTHGLQLAADYIASEFKKIGLKPGGTDGYFQPYRMPAGKAILQSSSVRLRGPLGQEIELAAGQQYQVVGMAGSGKISAPVVFVGYGVSTNEPSYDDYKNIDVAGKAVVVLRKTPYPGNSRMNFGGQRNQMLGSLNNKIVTADFAKAAAILFVNDRDTAGDTDKLMPFDYTSEADVPAKIPSVHIRRTVLESMLQESLATDLGTVEREIDRTAKPQSVPLTGWTASVELSIDRPTVEVKNIVGILEGAGPLAKEYVIVGAHYDHLGRGERGSLERDPKKITLIHHGADDNGSGTVSVVELARRFAQRKERDGRTLVFMTFSGEEQGLLGSRHFCNDPTVSLERTAAMVNLDMVGRVRPDKDTKKDKLEIGGIGSAKTFGPLVDDLNKKYDFKLSKTASAFGPSDHTSFADKKVPVFFFFTGLHEQYHKPSDTIDTINFDGMKKVVDFCEDLVGALAMVQEKPQYVQTSRPFTMGSGRGNIPRLGIMPGNYNEAEEKGVLIGGVGKDGPAEKAGLKEGDFIVEIAGKPVKNITAYMTVLSGVKRGEPLELTLVRGGQRLKVSIKPE
jgi:hypothetical protein